MPKHDSEEALARHVIDWLEAQHWDVYQEVRGQRYGGPIADIVAVRDPVVWVIECKRSLNLSVLAQAGHWKVHRRSIAIPRTQRRRDRVEAFARRVCREFSIGLIEMGRTGKVYETLAAPVLTEFAEQAGRLRHRLRPAQKHYAPAGSAGGARWSPYRDTLDEVRRIITDRPGCTLVEILDELERHHYDSDQSARLSLGRALREWESWCVADETRIPTRYYLAESAPSEAHELALFAAGPEEIEPDRTHLPESGDRD